jgi:NADPH:quinone reductase
MSVPVPFTPGSELVGTVSAVGEGDRGLARGDTVGATLLVGAFAEEAVLQATAVRPIPAGVDGRSAAAFGVAHRTAYHVLRSVGCVQPGEELVVLGAGGGVGLAAVELGAILGATVTAVASSTEKLEVAASYGATRLINHRTAGLREQLRSALPEGGDVVVDPVGGTLAEPALRALRWGGRFVTVGFAAGDIPRIPLNLVLLKGVVIRGFEYGGFATHAPDEARRNDDEVTALFAAGRVRPHVGASFPLEQTAAALRYVADGHAIGKVVLDIAR